MPPRTTNTTSRPRMKRKPRINIRKTCRLCENNIPYVDFKDVELLRKYQTEKGKVLSRRVTGNCSKHQKMFASAIKKARNMALVM
ncbi:MAG: 30S ribosomal protein S18 [Lentisphaerae bacterium GWF2_50_93]|nr:MAG: 30S ribosomal protein S18 [Lentisphaerae bacterium GWF2_50_93]